MRSETVTGATTSPVIVDTAKFAELDVPDNTLQLFTSGDEKKMSAELLTVTGNVKRKVVEICDELQKVVALFIMVGITKPMACVEYKPDGRANWLQPVISASV